MDKYYDALTKESSACKVSKSKRCSKARQKLKRMNNPSVLSVIHYELSNWRKLRGKYLSKKSRKSNR